MTEHEMTEHEWVTTEEPMKLMALLLVNPASRPSDRKLRLLTCAMCRSLLRAFIWIYERTLAGVEVADRYIEGQATREELSAAHEAARALVDEVAYDAYLDPRGGVGGSVAACEAVVYLTAESGTPSIRPHDVVDPSSAASRDPVTDPPSVVPFIYDYMDRFSPAACDLLRGVLAAPTRASEAVCYAAVCRCLDAPVLEGALLEGGLIDAAALTRAEKDQAVLIRDVFGNPFRPITISSAVLAWSDSTVVRLAQAAYEERQLPAGRLDDGRLAVLADALEESGCADSDILGHLRGPGPHVRGCWAVDLLLGKG
jgi:hypothetical protein